MIEILASGHLALSFHMDLDKLFSSCLVVHAVFDPSFTTKQRAHFNPHGACDSADQDASELSVLEFKGSVCTFS